MSYRTVQRKHRSLRFPWANISLLVLIVAQIVSGSVGLISGAEERAWVLWLHGIGAYAIVLALVWKSAIVSDSLGHRRIAILARAAFITLVALLLATLATGLLWTFAGRRLVYDYSLITIHIIFAFAVLGILTWHVLHMRFIFRIKQATGRRAFLRIGGTMIGGLALWGLAGLIISSFSLPGSKRRFTGSYETGSFTGDFPVVMWLFDYPPPVDVTRWQLSIEGAVERPFILTYEQLEQMAEETKVSIIDCTGGWYSAQEWQGVSVGRILDMAGVKAGGRSVSFEAVSGYGRRFGVEETGHFLLALGVAGRRLDHSHGFPVRLVAPDHRGFEWVKWLTRIRVNESSQYLQPPVPLQ